MCQQIHSTESVELTGTWNCEVLCVFLHTDTDSEFTHFTS